MASKDVHDADASRIRPLPITKMSSGIAGLDEILHGGVPKGRTTLVVGGPGTGKTVLGVEFLYHAARDGHPGIFVLFEERAEAVRVNARALGWDLAALEADGHLEIIDAQLDPRTVIDGEFGLDAFFAIIDGKARAMGASCIVVDSLDRLIQLFSDNRRRRNELYALNDWLLEQDLTALLTFKGANPLEDGRDLAPDQSQCRFMEYMVDCVLVLDQRVLGQRSTRRLRVVKYRGSDYSRNEYPYIITEGGIRCIPISSAQFTAPVPAETLSSGHEQLDTILGGGYHRGSTVLVSGPSGIGKTALVSTATLAAVARGERVLSINFEESEEMLVKGMRSLGIDLSPALEEGLFEMRAMMPEAMGPEEHLIFIVDRIESFRPAHLVLDAISACRRMASDAIAYDLIVRLINACRKRGVTVLLTNQTRGVVDGMTISGLGLSSLIDTVILMRYYEIEVDDDAAAHGALARRLIVLKSRGAAHSPHYHRFVMTDEGIRLAAVDDGDDEDNDAGGCASGCGADATEKKDERGAAG